MFLCQLRSQTSHPHSSQYFRQFRSWTQEKQLSADSLHLHLQSLVSKLVKWYLQLAYSEKSTLWSVTSSRVGDHTPIVACIVCLNSSDLQSNFIIVEVLPLFTATLTPGWWWPLPLVGKRFCSSGLDSEGNRIPWKNIFLAWWMRGDFRRLGYTNEKQATL